jgi:hypothetical protein
MGNNFSCLPVTIGNTCATPLAGVMQLTCVGKIADNGFKNVYSDEIIVFNKMRPLKNGIFILDGHASNHI